jgi:3-oxoacyl-[acyl-carrier-protein] synthase II
MEDRRTMPDREAVWITGIGAATPLGQSYDEIGRNFLAGRSGIRAVTHFDTTDQPCTIAGTLGPIPAPDGWDGDTFARLGPWQQLLVWCGVNALRDAGLWERRADLRIGLVVGIGGEWVLTWEAGMLVGDDRIRDPGRDRTSLTHFAREALGLSGPCATVAAACASGNVALAQGRRWVERGWVDVCLAGGCDRSVSPMGMAGFGNLGALSKRNHDPAAASRPFDRGRDGFVMGEAGALLVLEPASSARRRSARAYGAIAGYGASSDAYHMVIPSPDPVPCIRAMRSALADAGVAPDEVDYVNAHGTSTPVGDVFETRVLREVLGRSAATVPVSSTKSMTGHLLSATAAVEALACLVAFERGAIPPTINLDDPDPECDLCHVPHEAREQAVKLAVSNSFGFGGSNTCLVLRRA